MTSLRSLFLSVAAAVALSALAACQPERLFLEDVQGREIVLHGINVTSSAKSDPLGVGWPVEEDYERIAGWGFNTVRLLVFWSSLEPQEGLLDDAYLDRVQERVDWAAAHGLKVFLDMHQDLYGPKFSADGAPFWATRDDGLPFDLVAPWWLNYLSPAVRASFSHLWRDADLQEHFFAAWAHAAARFAGHPAVIGFEILNEPFVGNESVTAFEPGFLYPFYQGTAAAIRAAAPEATVFFEAGGLTNSGLVPSFLPPIGPGRWVYSPHFYQMNVHEGGDYNGNDAVITSTFQMRAREAAAHAAPWILGEFGAADTTVNFDLYLKAILREMDALGSGWTYWSYDKGSGFSVLREDGSEKTTLTDLLIRPYPRAVAGAIRTYAYDPNTRAFELTFAEKQDLAGPTEIQVPASRLYPNGFTVTSTDPAGTWSYTFDAAREVVLVTSDPGHATHTLRVVPQAG